MAARNSTILDRMDLAAEMCRQVGLCAVSRALLYVQCRELFSCCALRMGWGNEWDWAYALS